MSMDTIKNRNFVLVGRMGYPLSDLKKEITRRGGKVKTEVTMETDFLVRGVIHPTDKTAERDNAKVEQATLFQKEGSNIKLLWVHDLFTLFADVDEGNHET